MAKIVTIFLAFIWYNTGNTGDVTCLGNCDLDVNYLFILLRNLALGTHTEALGFLRSYELTASKLST